MVAGFKCSENGKPVNIFLIETVWFKPWFTRLGIKWNFTFIHTLINQSIMFGHFSFFHFKSLAEELLKQVHEMRMQIIERRKQKLIEEKRKQNAKASMQQARDLACSILELSSSDLDNFLIEEEQEEVCSSFFSVVISQLRLYSFKNYGVLRLATILSPKVATYICNHWFSN